MCTPHRSRASLVVFLGLAALVVAGTTTDGPSDTRPGIDEEVVMIDERFEVAPGGRFIARVPDADVIVEQGTDREARIEVLLIARDLDRAREYFASQRYRVDRAGGDVRVVADPERRSGFNWNWNRTGGARIVVRATLPAAFDAEIRTSDGDVVLPALAGRLLVHTSDGDIRAGALTGGPVDVRTSDGDIAIERIDVPAGAVTVQTSDGDITLGGVTAEQSRIRTSDGDVVVDRLQGTAEVSTSDGNIRLGTATGHRLDARTSDGSIVIAELSADAARVRTSDGDIVLRAVAGPVDAVTASGDLDVRLLKPATATLRASDGDIVVTMPGRMPADLGLRGEAVRVDADFAFRGRVEKSAAEGALNGGGPRIEARSHAGTVSLRAEE